MPCHAPTTIIYYIRCCHVVCLVHGVCVCISALNFAVDCSGVIVAQPQLQHSTPQSTISRMRGLQRELPFGCPQYVLPMGNRNRLINRYIIEHCGVN